MTINDMCKHSYETAVEKGWWENGDREFGTVVALMHSELTEALEEWRGGRGFNETYFRDGDSKPEGIPSELADVLIRIGDFCGRHGIDLEAAVKQKMEFNKTRTYRHGNKAA